MLGKLSDYEVQVVSIIVSFGSFHEDTISNDTRVKVRSHDKLINGLFVQ